MITSGNNPNIKNIKALRKKARLRKEQDVFLVEGPKMFSEIPQGRLLETYASEKFLEEEKGRKLLEGVSYETVSNKLFEEISDTRTPQGILGVVRQFHYSLEDVLSCRPALVLLLEDIQDPGNLGTIIRAGEGAGITGVVMSRETADIYNPKVIRATMGSVFRVPFVYAEDFSQAVQKVKISCRVYAAHLKGAVAYDKADYRENSAILIGNEAKGLSEECAGLSHMRIKIPMEGKVESLNAAVAAAVLMYEAQRQRNM